MVSSPSFISMPAIELVSLVWDIDSFGGDLCRRSQRKKENRCDEGI